MCLTYVRSGVERTNHEEIVPPTSRHFQYHFETDFVSNTTYFANKAHPKLIKIIQSYKLTAYLRFYCLLTNTIPGSLLTKWLMTGAIPH